MKKLLFIICLFCATFVFAANAGKYRTIEWDELIPKSWDPTAWQQGVDVAKLNDDDPRAIAALKRLKEFWDKAPANEALNGTKARIVGFIIPLERKGDQVSELLLVPYFGACVHVPPPPANQVIHVVMDKPIKNAKMMDAFWISGVLSLESGDGQGMGAYSYRLKGEAVERYEEK